jgi:hypothetical protein
VISSFQFALKKRKISLTYSQIYGAVYSHPIAVYSHPMAVYSHPMAVYSHPMAVYSHPMAVYSHPIAVCSQVISSFQFALKKRKRNISLTYSQIYGAVTMNNTLCLGLFLFIVHARGLTWDFSAEVTHINMDTWHPLCGPRGTGCHVSSADWSRNILIPL